MKEGGNKGKGKRGREGGEGKKREANEMALSDLSYVVAALVPEEHALHPVSVQGCLDWCTPF